MLIPRERFLFLSHHPLIKIMLAEDYYMDLRVRLQIAEAFGPLNRWFCSQAYGHEVIDPELLLTYYIKSGGADDFARRFLQAMGPQNRWYCSEFYGREIYDPE